MIERIFRSSRFLVLVAVATTAISAVLLYGVSLNTMVACFRVPEIITWRIRTTNKN